MSVSDKHDLALFLHLSGVLVMTSGIAVATACFEAARRRDDTAVIAAMLGLARVGAIAVMAGAVLLLGGGFWLKDLDGLGWDVGWLNWAMSLFVLSLVFGALGGRQPRRARVLATRLASQGARVTTELRAALDERLSLVLNYGSGVLMLVILGLMVAKPS